MYRAPKLLRLRNPRWERKKSHPLQTYDWEETARTYVLIFDGKVRVLSPREGQPDRNQMEAKMLENRGKRKL